MISPASKNSSSSRKPPSAPTTASRQSSLTKHTQYLLPRPPTYPRPKPPRRPRQNLPSLSRLRNLNRHPNPHNLPPKRNRLAKAAHPRIPKLPKAKQPLRAAKTRRGRIDVLPPRTQQSSH